MTQSAGDDPFAVHLATLTATLDQLDYYTLLGVPRSATADQIKRAYHHVAGIYHPDAHGDAPETLKQQLHVVFKRVTEAYRVLHDTPRRKRYDGLLAQGGEQRLTEGRREQGGPRSPDAELKTPAGKKCFLQALQAIKRKDYKGAKRDLQLALTYEGGNSPAVKAKMAEVDQLLKS